jgi:hypothetical protein
MTSAIKRTRVMVLTVAVAAMAIFGAFAASQAQAALRHFDGTVLSKNADNHTFRIRAESGNRVQFHVNGNTEFERIPGGFSGLTRGLRVEVDARRTDRGLVATKVEKHRSGGGGHHGGGDDGPNHG